MQRISAQEAADTWVLLWLSQKSLPDREDPLYDKGLESSPYTSKTEAGSLAPSLNIRRKNLSLSFIEQQIAWNNNSSTSKGTRFSGEVQIN